MAYAMNYDVHKSMDALEAATTIAPAHFWAQLTLRRTALPAAGVESSGKPDASRRWSWPNPLAAASLARRQLQEIRRLSHDTARNVTWNKPLLGPALVLCGMLLAAAMVMMWT